MGCSHIPSNRTYHLPRFPDVAILNIKGKRFVHPEEKCEYQIWISGYGRYISAGVWTNPQLGLGLDQQIAYEESEITEHEMVMLWGITVKFPVEGNYYIKVRLWNKFTKDVQFYHIQCIESPEYEQPRMPWIKP